MDGAPGSRQEAGSFGLGRRVETNIGLKAASEILVKSGRFLLVLIAARVLGPEGFGVYSFAFAIGNILANASDFGLQMHLSREVAQRTEDRAAVLRQAIRAKGLLLLATCAVLAILAFAYPRTADIRILLVLMSAATLLRSVNELGNYFFRGIQSLREEAFLNLLNMAAGTGLGIGLLLTGHGLAGLILALIAGELLTLVVAIFLLRRRGAFVPVRSVPRASEAIREAAPIGLAILLSILYFRIDILILERFQGDAAVGSYNAAYRLLESALFLPAAFLAGVYPAFADTLVHDRAATARLFKNSLRWLAVLSGLLAAGCVGLAPVLLRLLYGESYAGAAGILRILALSLPFLFVNYALTHFLIAFRAQRWNAIAAGACLLLNLGLNLILIPRLAGVGAAIATVLTEAALFVICWIVLRRRMSAGPAGAPGLGGR